ncbi:type II toxin-antitoxin system RelE/ParE family toxin [Candidatus Uhrbacteria bacterium]|nr:type II toxin-antitoxin system RelE/ParE family toxin [Candidatus Uhrbacteria bacterium]
MEYFFAPRALKQLQKFPHNVQVRIITKLDFFCATDSPLFFAESLIQSDLGHYRFRIGDYRVIFDLVKEGLDILYVGHRKDIYR